MHRVALLLLFSAVIGPAFSAALPAQTNANVRADAPVFKQIADYALSRGEVYGNLRHLCKNMPRRISGSTDSRKAIAWTQSLMSSYGFDQVRLQSCMVPTWERGKTARGTVVRPGARDQAVRVCALGGSVPTPKRGLTAEILQVAGNEGIRQLPAGAAKGKILFVNTRLDRTHINPYQAYLEAVMSRIHCAAEGARVGAAAVLVRSLTFEPDTYPHTGFLKYPDGVARIPAAAIASLHADWLEAALQLDPKTRFALTLDCQRLPGTESANVLGQLCGTEFPNEVIVLGAHLDGWDLGEGAHDDGGGCVQVIEALRILKQLGIQPRRTIRAVLYDNEENGLAGSAAYAAEATRNANLEQHLFALETDTGAFAPVGFGFAGDATKIAKIRAARALFAPYGLQDLESGGGGYDIQALAPLGTVLAGLSVQGHRYFDYHHTERDVFEMVNKRELELGAASMAMLVYWVSEHGL